MQQYDYLIDYALKNNWCSPGQDKQVIVKPAKISKVGGEWGFFTLQWRNITLPEQHVRFHVYQIGQLHPLLMGLFPSRQWMSFTQCCNTMKLVADLYVDSGLQLPRFDAYYMVTRDKNLIIAVKEPLIDRLKIDLDKEPLFLRVYTNAYFSSARSSPLDDFIHTNGKRVLSTTELLTIQNEYNQYLARPGYTYAFVNGYRVDAIDMINAKVGDFVEYVYDSSIKMVYDFPIADLKTYVDYMDDERKYFLHYAGQGDRIIEYQDDVDVFLYKTTTGSKFKGIYYHKNEESGFRMVTHKDYGISVERLDWFSSQQPDWTDMTQLTIRLHIRKSGYFRPLIFENNRIHELYKLKDDDLVRAVLGLDSTVDVFKAENLEASGYCAIMRAKNTCLSRELIQDAYGYNAISKILADTPSFVRVESQQNVIDVPYGLTHVSTGYEYDEDGLLIDWHSHVGGSIYATRSLEAHKVEMIAGYTTDLLDEVYGEQTVTIDPTANYRFYTCPIVNGNPSNNWTDVTDSGQYAIVDNKVTWFTDPATTYTLVRGDTVNLGYRLSLPNTDGLLKFSLKHRAYRNGVVSDWIMQIPMGELDLFLNRRSLIEGVDYIVNFPEIVIFNKEYLENPGTQNQEIVVRFTGFCKSDMTREKLVDQGFVDHALLSNNNRFDIRDDKVLRITVDGKLYDRSELLFAEDNSGVSAPDARNGAPYLIRDIVVPLRGLTNENTYTMRAKSQVIDKQVSDYMSLKMPKPTFDTPNVILDELYAVFSPFVCKIMNDLNHGIINDPRIKDHYNDELVKELCAEYEYLLAYDPAHPDNEIDPRFVIVHPHNLYTVVDMDIYAYTFLNRVVKLYIPDRVQLSHFIRITPSP